MITKSKLWHFTETDLLRMITFYSPRTKSFFARTSNHLRFYTFLRKNKFSASKKNVDSCKNFKLLPVKYFQTNKFLELDSKKLSETILSFWPWKKKIGANFFGHCST